MELGVPLGIRLSYTERVVHTLVRRLACLGGSVAAAAITLAGQQGSVTAPVVATPPFERYLDLLRQQAGIPGLSAAIVKDSQISWERGFGYQNQEARIVATPDTPYLVGDISQTLATVLLLQCVEERHLDLDDPVSRFGVKLPDSDATLQQVLSHTSAAGAPFRYDLERFTQSTTAMEWCAPQAYRKSVAHRILERLAMKDSVPGRDLRDPGVVPPGLFDQAAFERYSAVLDRLAVPYKLDKKGKAVRSDPLPPAGITAADGLVSTVRDLARLDAAIDDLILLRGETLSVAWRNVLARDGTPSPTGLGWFVQGYEGELVVWQFGLIPGAYSSLVLKLPARRATLILLANSDGLSAPYQLSQGDVTRSLFASVFLKLVIQ
jgi:CubicO group peptidase (beta-lactamase class C family)